MTKKSTPSKLKIWTRQIAQWRRSGQSVAAFCRQQRLSEPNFYAWRKRLSLGGKPAKRAMFVPVTVAPAPVAGQSVELVLRWGRVLRLQGEVSMPQLVEFVKLLEATPC